MRRWLDDQPVADAELGEDVEDRVRDGVAGGTEAERALADRPLDRFENAAPAANEDIDSAAAAVILERWLAGEGEGK